MIDIESVLRRASMYDTTIELLNERGIRIVSLHGGKWIVAHTSINKKDVGTMLAEAEFFVFADAMRFALSRYAMSYAESE